MGGAILSGVMLAISILVFFVLKIPTVIGDLTGANARKAIENIRSHNESTGEKTYRTSQVNRERGRLTDKITPSGRLERQRTGSLHGAMGTEKIGTQQLNIVEAGNETTVLSGDPMGSNETTVLSEELSGGGETTLLTADIGNGNTADLTAHSEAVEFTVEYEITYIHTDEVIA